MHPTERPQSIESALLEQNLDGIRDAIDRILDNPGDVSLVIRQGACADRLLKRIAILAARIELPAAYD